MKKALYILIAVVIGFSSCDVIEPPYEVDKDPIPIDTTQKYRKVLIEDYTGHLCPNCPESHDTLEGLIEHYGGNVIGISIHAGVYFSDPDPPDYPTDFRTTVGSDLDTYFGASGAGLPKGVVNRKEYDGGMALDWGVWDFAVQEILANDLADIYLTIENDYNSSSKVITTTINTEFLTEMEGNYNLSVFVVEDSIIAPQKVGTVRVEDYVHMHVFRGAFNGTWGDVIATGTTAADETFTNTLTYTLDAENVAENCSIVAFVFNSDTDEVIQAEKKHLIEH